MSASPRDRPARAAVALAAALLALALPLPPPRAEPCPRPSERAAREGRTAEVECAAPGQTARALRGPARRLFGLAIDPNAADALTLETLPGIGPARAAAIRAERERRRFESFGELARVRGIGPRTLERLAGLVEVRNHP